MTTSVQLALSFAAVQPAGAAAEPPPETKSLLDHILSGGPIGYTIIGLSFVLVGLIIFHLIQIRESKLAPGDVVSELDGLLESGDVKGALAYCRNPANDCFLTRMFASALARCSRSPFGFLELRSALEEAGQEQVARLYRAVDAIGLIAAVAPMLGLLGTVVGMVSAFETISTTEGGFARPDELAGSISIALITTVLGLIVAIPATAVFSFLRNRIDSLASSVAELTEDISAHLESASPNKAPSKPGAQTRRPGPGAGQPTPVKGAPAP